MGAEEKARKAKAAAEKLSKRDGTTTHHRDRYSSSGSDSDSDSRLSGEFSDPSEYDISMQPPSSDEEPPHSSTKLGEKAIDKGKTEKVANGNVDDDDDDEDDVENSCSSKDSEDESVDGDTVVKRTKPSTPLATAAAGSI